MHRIFKSLDKERKYVIAMCNYFAKTRSGRPDFIHRLVRQSKFILE